MLDHHNQKLPLAIRVSLFAAQHDGERLSRGQLRYALDPYLQPSDISRAIAMAIRLNVLAPTSSARCLHVQTPTPLETTPA